MIINLATQLQLATMPGLEYLVEVSVEFWRYIFVNYMDAAYIFNQNPPIPHLSNPWQLMEQIILDQLMMFLIPQMYMNICSW